MSIDETRRRDPVVVGLLAALVALVAAQLLFQGYVLWRVQAEAAAAKPALDRAMARLDELQQRLDSDGPHRMAVGADEVARQTLAKVKDFNARRAALDGIRKGPLEKVDQVIVLNQLLADELAAMLHHLAMTQGVLAQPGLSGDEKKNEER